MRRHARRKKPVDKVLGALVNILSIVYAHFYFPTYSNGLKEVGGWLGCSWTGENASGAQCIAWRARWESTHDEQWKARLIEYNQEDCVALQRVTDFLYAACTLTPTTQEAQRHEAGGVQIARVQDLDKLADTARFGRVNFVHSEFEFVNKCAYFDYQRQRVFVRTSKMIKKHGRKPGLWRNRRIRASQLVDIASSKCPACGDTNLVDLPKSKKVRVKRAFDLVITPGGIKRRVIECRAAVYRCSQCEHCFTSERYPEFAVCGHTLCLVTA
jgi:RNase_H superfamily